MIDPNAKKKLRITLLDAGVISGSVLFVFGLYLIWHPLAPLVGGLLLAGACFFADYDKLRRSNR